MKIVLSLNNQERLYDYISMGIDTFILGGQYSFHCPYVFSLDDMTKIIGNYPEQIFYVSMNALYDQYMMSEVEGYIEQLSQLPIQGIVFQDFGILQIVKERGYTFDMMLSLIHISTTFTCD